MKVLILADVPGWIVDRITDRMIKGIDFDFTKQYYAKVRSEEFIKVANQSDLVHYGNWDLKYHIKYLNQIKVPLLVSIRSHRFPPYVRDMAAEKKFHTHIISPFLQEDFPDAHYIPDGVFEQFIPNTNFVVGYAGKPDKYKGYDLIRQACEELGVTFWPAIGDMSPADMPTYYRRIDLLVCASQDEGFGAPLMECLAMNRPVITTDVGMAKLLNVHKVGRSVEGIKEGISRFYTNPQVFPKYSWDNVCRQFKELYERIVNDNPK